MHPRSNSGSEPGKSGEQREGPAIFLTGGGTGGHLFPGIAIARQLVETLPGMRPFWIGSTRPLEREILQREKISHQALSPLPLHWLWRNPVRFIWNWSSSLRNAGRLIKAEQPALVIGLGGFASVPTVWMAVRRRIPIVLLEHNVIPGKAIRWLAGRADCVCLAFAETAQYLPQSTRWKLTGAPVRPEIAKLADAEDLPQRDPQTVLILGGSQGAEHVNEAVVEMVSAHADRYRQTRFIHQTGHAQAEMVRRRYADAGIEHRVEPFFSDMAEIYRAADLAISRAGATTLAEIACAGLPTILVPYPYAADDHQRANAREFVQAGAARVVEQGPDVPATADLLDAELSVLLEDRQKTAAMRSAMRSFARTDATASIAEICCELMRQ